MSGGQSVLQSQDGVIYGVFPNSRKVEVKRIEPPSQVVSVNTITLGETTTNAVLFFYKFSIPQRPEFSPPANYRSLAAANS